jgi:hypothetical protein
MRTVFFFLILATAVAVILNTSAQLPEIVAVHFGADNLANGRMSRDAYIHFTMMLTVGLPLLIGGSMAWLPRIAPQSLNIPNRDYWLAPERQEETLGFLGRHGYRLGMLLIGLFTAMHFVIIQANSVMPAQLPASRFMTILGIFLAGNVLWAVGLMHHFRRP